MQAFLLQKKWLKKHFLYDIMYNRKKENLESKGYVMKKTALILILVMTFLIFTSCGILEAFGSMNGGEQGSSGGGSDIGGGSSEGGTTEGEGETPENPDGNDNPRPPAGDNDPTEDDNGDLITVSEVLGLNEQIFVSISASEGFSYSLFYRLAGETDYTELDEELMIADGDEIKCYILGIKKGKYEIKIEAESESVSARKNIGDISVQPQDRSGYAHFTTDEGVGAYNNDGTVKDGATILYVTNENKNTVTMTIGGTEYVGLVNILQAQHKATAPLLVRIIGKISTNQWNYKNVEPRLTNGSNDNPGFFENSFSTMYGENLANLKVQYSDKKAGRTYIYKTTETGLVLEREKGGSTGTTTYKGSSFPSLVGKTVYDDDSSINMISVQAAKNITIEGVGEGAEIFQFGIGFEECNSIEIKNLIFSSYPEDALNFLAENDVTVYGNYWVHNNTFNRGYNAWDITGERDKYAGDGSVDMAFIHSLTMSYNEFNNCKKTMLVGNSDSSRCMNISIHHNHFNKVESRLPLCRNSNVHSYNNYFNDCGTCASVRVNSYLFSEANYYYSCSTPFYQSASAIKSFGDVFVLTSSSVATVVTKRDQTVSNSCKPDKVTDYSKFDTNPDLFYYDTEKGSTGASVMLNAEDLPDFVTKYSGAGRKVQLLVENINTYE